MLDLSLTVFADTLPTRAAGWVCLLQVPAWVPHSLHTGNSIAAILDLLVCGRHRPFNRRAEIGQTMITVGYVIWLVTCRSHTGSFPYPFM